MRNLAILGAVLLLGGCTSAERYEERYPKDQPILVFTVPIYLGFMRILNTPNFALYGDGTAIYVLWGEKGYERTWFSSEEIKEMLSEDVPIPKLAQLKEKYILSSGFHQPLYKLDFCYGGNHRSVALYGNLDEPLPDDQEGDPEVDLEALPPLRSPGFRPTKKTVPPDFYVAYKFLHKFRKEGAEKWKPSHLEVILEPYEQAEGEPILWPKEWPDLKDENTKKADERYRIFLPWEYYDDFISFINTRKPLGTFEVNGKSFSIRYRIPFPHESPGSKYSEMTCEVLPEE